MSAKKFVKEEQYKSGLEKYAERELAYAFPLGEDEDDSMQRLMNENILELIQVFSDQDHSGFSAPYCLKYFNRLAHWKPITPLTGEESEWNEPYGDDNTQQNKRCASVFRDHFDNATAIDIDAKIAIDEDGLAFRTPECRAPITFPYTVPDEPERIPYRDDKFHGV